MNTYKMSILRFMYLTSLGFSRTQKLISINILHLPRNIAFDLGS